MAQNPDRFPLYFQTGVSITFIDFHLNEMDIISVVAVGQKNTLKVANGSLNSRLVTIVTHARFECPISFAPLSPLRGGLTKQGKTRDSATTSTPQNASSFNFHHQSMSSKTRHEDNLPNDISSHIVLIFRTILLSPKVIIFFFWEGKVISRYL